MTGWGMLREAALRPGSKWRRRSWPPDDAIFFDYHVLRWKADGAVLALTQLHDILADDWEEVKQ